MRRSILLLSCAIIGALATAVLAGSCGTAATQPDHAQALEGKTWRATTIAGLTKVQTAKGSAATAKFAAGRAGGAGSVNSWGASYTAGPGDAIHFSEIATTEMAGPQDLMDQEAAYYAALPRAATYKVSEISLTLFDSKGETLVIYEAVPPTPLTGTEWRMTGYHVGASPDQTVSSDDPVITATFAADGTLSGNGGVNRYSTTYRATADGSMTIDPQIVSTKMAGPEPAMAQESAYLAALPKTAGYAIDGDQLTLKDASGAVVALFTAQ